MYLQPFLYVFYHKVLEIPTLSGAFGKPFSLGVWEYNLHVY